MKAAILTLLFYTTLLGQEASILSIESLTQDKHTSSDKAYFPKDFFSGTPKDTIFKLVDKNRNIEHRSKFSLLFEEDTQYNFHKRSTISYSYQSSSCHTSIQLHTFINIEEDNSYIIVNSSDPIASLCYGSRTHNPYIALLYKKIDFEAAKYIDEVFFWLNKLNAVNHTIGNQSDLSFSFSTADGSAELKMVSSKEKSAIKANEWFGTLKKRWSTSLNDEARISFAGLIIKKGVLTKFASTLYQNDSSKDFAEQILVDYTTDPLLPREITSNCLNIIDYNLDLTLDPQIIQNITKNFKINQQFLKELKDAKLLSLQENYDHLALTDKQKELLKSDEYKSIKIIEKCNKMLLKLRVCKDKNALFKLATSKDNIHEWALVKLKEYPELYVQALTYWLDKKDPKNYSKIFHKILIVNKSGTSGKCVG
ncbi:MAG: hypothetical protein NE334_05715 [Lentisphaeraceae bacterium]|nr:hypothetical protein [Lentisphaeraceae bacterium]